MTILAGTYGYGGYASGIYKCGGHPKLHYYSLKKIFPVPDMTGYFDDDLDIEGKYLDNAYYQAMGILDELFPLSSDDLLPTWEGLFGLPDTGSITARQQAVSVKEQVVVSKNSRLSKQYYIDIAATMGYTITITEGVDHMFIVASTSPPASTITGQLYDADDIFEWTIHGTIPLANRPVFEETMNALSPAWTRLLYDYI